MNVVNIIKCGICGAHTNVKVQLGYINDFYISVPCLKCGSLINGKGHLDPPKYNFDFNFENLKNCDRYDFDYYCECSPELIVKKPKFLFIKEQSHDPIFFDNAHFLGKNIEKYSFKYVYDYVNNIILKWEYNRNLINLYINNKYKILSEKVVMDEDISEKYVKENELCFYKHICFRRSYDLFLFTPSHNLNDFSKKFEKEFLNLDSSQIKEILRIMNQRNMFIELNKKILDLSSKIVDKIVYLVPALTAQFFENKIEFNIYGASSCKPDDIVDLYKDCFETFTLFIPIIIMLNNVKYRGTYDSCNRNNMNIEKYFDMPKGNLIKELDYNEFFSYLFYDHLDKIIRNSIGHNDYQYDSINQKITFKDKSNCREMFLLEFMLECIELIYCFINLENMFYYLERANFNLNGFTSDYLLTEYPRKMERNEKCLCGSGKKYKKCHYI